jgi:uncharacterized protein with PQ loop repeat
MSGMAGMEAAAPAATPAAVPAAAAAPVPNRGDNAWLMVATAFVILMSIPGLALFYGGLVRSKNMLSVLMQVFVIFSVISVLWAVYGYSVAFTEGNAFFGSLDKLFLKGITPDSVAATFSKGVVVSEFIFVAFQGAFAAITCGLIVGAFAERIKFSAVLLFMVLWFSFSYLPMTHMVWYWTGPDAYTTAEAAKQGHRYRRLPVPEGRARLCRRYRGAYQCRHGRPGRRLHGRQARRLRQGLDGAALADHDHDRRLAAVVRLVRLQRRFGARSQRHGGPGLRQYLAGDRHGGDLLDGDGVAGQGQALDARCGAPVLLPAWWRSLRRPASSAWSAPWSSASLPA